MQTSIAAVPVVIVGVVPPGHLGVDAHVAVAVPPADPFVIHITIVCPEVGFENVKSQALPDVSVTVKALPVDQSTVLAVVQVESACVATVVWATVAVPEISVKAG